MKLKMELKVTCSQALFALPSPLVRCGSSHSISTTISSLNLLPDELDLSTCLVEHLSKRPIGVKFVGARRRAKSVCPRPTETLDHYVRDSEEIQTPGKPRKTRRAKKSKQCAFENYMLQRYLKEAHKPASKVAKPMWKARV